MKHRKVIGIIATVMLLACLAVIPVSAQVVPNPPLLVYGDVTIGGDAALVGTTISAEIGGAEIISVVTTVAGEYTIMVPSQGAAEKTVVFKVNGMVGGQYTGIVDGFAVPPGVNLDLAAGGVPGTYTLTMAVSPAASGTTVPAVGAHPGYAAGTGVQVSATPAGEGMEFDYWIINSATVTANPTTVTMNSDVTVTAYFTPITPPGEYPVLSWWLSTL